MAHERDTSPESHVTTDTETVQSWTSGRDVVPVRREVDGEHQLDLVREAETTSDQEELSWEEFQRELRNHGMVVARHGDEGADVDVVDRSEVVGRTTVQSELATEALVEGETVETEITDRTVVEHVLVEEATVQSEVVDREIVQSDIVDVDLLTTEVNECSVSRAESPDESTTDLTWFQPGTELQDPYDVEIDVQEGWELTREVVERLTIESRIVESDVEETETIETDTMRETIDIEGVTETILEGELVESPETASTAVESGHVESQFREDDVIETHVLRRQTIDEEMSVAKEIRGEVSDAETVSADAIAHTVVDSEIVSEEEYDVDLAATVAAAETVGTETDEETTMGIDEEATTADEETSMDIDEEATTADETAAPMADDADTRVVPKEEDQGKAVVNPNGDEVGMVAAVDDGQIYVDPDPSLTDRIRTVLGWGDPDEDTYHLGSDHIDHIDENRVVLRFEREE